MERTPPYGSRRYRRTSVTVPNEVASQGEAIQELQFGNRLPTFRASISGDFVDLATERRPYWAISGTPGNDTVFWDYWDNDYDRRFFEPVLGATPPDVGRLGAVTLLVPGLYAISASIDWMDEPGTLGGSFGTWLTSNYDAGGMTYIPIDLGNQTGLWTLNHFRVVWPTHTGAENSVEITAGHDNVAEEPLYIPGDIWGYWGFPPHLTIVYLGGLGTEARYFEDAP